MVTIGLIGCRKYIVLNCALFLTGYSLGSAALLASSACLSENQDVSRGGYIAGYPTTGKVLKATCCIYALLGW